MSAWLAAFDPALVGPCLRDVYWRHRAKVAEATLKAAEGIVEAAKWGGAAEAPAGPQAGKEKAAKVAAANLKAAGANLKAVEGEAAEAAAGLRAAKKHARKAALALEAQEGKAPRLEGGIAALTGEESAPRGDMAQQLEHEPATRRYEGPGMPPGGNNTTGSEFQDIEHQPGPWSDTPPEMSPEDYNKHKERQVEEPKLSAQQQADAVAGGAQQEAEAAQQGGGEPAGKYNDLSTADSHRLLERRDNMISCTESELASVNLKLADLADTTNCQVDHLMAENTKLKEQYDKVEKSSEAGDILLKSVETQSDLAHQELEPLQIRMDADTTVGAPQPPRQHADATLRRQLAVAGVLRAAKSSRAPFSVLTRRAHRIVAFTERRDALVASLTKEYALGTSLALDEVNNEIRNRFLWLDAQFEPSYPGDDPEQFAKWNLFELDAFSSLRPLATASVGGETDLLMEATAQRAHMRMSWKRWCSRIDLEQRQHVRTKVCESQQQRVVAEHLVPSNAHCTKCSSWCCTDSICSNGLCIPCCMDVGCCQCWEERRLAGVCIKCGNGGRGMCSEGLCTVCCEETGCAETGCGSDGLCAKRLKQSSNEGPAAAAPSDWMLVSRSEVAQFCSMIPTVGIDTQELVDSIFDKQHTLWFALTESLQQGSALESLPDLSPNVEAGRATEAIYRAAAANACRALSIQVLSSAIEEMAPRHIDVSRLQVTLNSVRTILQCEPAITGSASQLPWDLFYGTTGAGAGAEAEGGADEGAEAGEANAWAWSIGHEAAEAVARESALNRAEEAECCRRIRSLVESAAEECGVVLRAGAAPEVLPGTVEAQMQAEAGAITSCGAKRVRSPLVFETPPSSCSTAVPETPAEDLPAVCEPSVPQPAAHRLSAPHRMSTHLLSMGVTACSTDELKSHLQRTQGLLPDSYYIMRQEELGSSHALEGADQLTGGDTIRVCWRLRGGARGSGGNGSRGKQLQAAAAKAAAEEKDAAALKASEGHAALTAANKQMQAGALKAAKQKQAATLKAAYEEHGKGSQQCDDAFTRGSTTGTVPAAAGGLPLQLDPKIALLCSAGTTTVTSEVVPVVPAEAAEIATAAAEPALQKCLDCRKPKHNEDLCDAGSCRDCCLGMSCWDNHIQGTPATSVEDRVAPCTSPCTGKAAAPVPAPAAGGRHAKTGPAAKAIAAEAGAETDAEASSMAWHSTGTLANCSSNGSDDWDLRKMEAAASAKQSKLATAKAKNIRKTEQTTAKPKKIRKTEQKQDIHTERHLDHLALEGILRRQSRLDRSAIQRSIQSTVATEKLEAGVHDLTHLPDVNGQEVVHVVATEEMVEQGYRPPACRVCDYEDDGGFCEAGLCENCCHSTSCWINHTYTSSEDEADQLDVNAGQADANTGANAAAQVPIPPTAEAANAQVGDATQNVDAEAVAATAEGGGGGSPASSNDKTPIASPSSSEKDDGAYAAKHPYHEQWHLPSEKLKLQQFRDALPTCCIDQATPQGGWVKPLETRLQQCSCHCCLFNNAKQVDTILQQCLTSKAM